MSNEGKLITAHVSFALTDGTLVEDTRKRNEPLQFICTEGGQLPGVIKAVTDMNVGDKKILELTAEEGFGKYNLEWVETKPLTEFPNADHLPVGKFIYTEEADGTMIPAKVVSLTDEGVTLDYNHPMAGKELVYSIEIMSIEDFDPRVH